MNLRDRIRFDRDALDDAIEEQAGLFLQASDEQATAVSRRDQAKSIMEEEFAAACDRARRGRSEERKTEAAVKEAAQLDRQYKKADNEYRELKLAADLATALREAFDMRGKMLREMAQLYIAGYYQTNAVSGKDRKEVADREHAANRATLHEARQRRLRNGPVHS